MPTYLTPGVYVEEIPSANKPIEGVGTSIAAFVGLAPGGPVNKPMRISNWTQFANDLRRPQEPGQRPVHGGRVPRARRLRLLPERRQPRWIVRVGGEGDAQAPRAALPAAADRGIEAFRAVALQGVTGTIKVDVVRGTVPTEGKDGEPTYTLMVTAGTDREEYRGLRRKKGRRTSPPRSTRPRS